MKERCCENRKWTKELERETPPEMAVSKVLSKWAILFDLKDEKELTTPQQRVGADISD